MALFDQIKDQAFQLLRGAGSSSDANGSEHPLLGAVMNAVRSHGLQDLLQQLQTGNLREAAASWVGHGANMPVTAEQLEQALGSGTIEKLASHVGLTGEQASMLLAQVLPHAVDRLTPNGTVESDTPPEPETCATPTTEATEQ